MMWSEGWSQGRYWLLMPCSRNKPSESAQEDWDSAAPPQTSSCDTSMHQSDSLILISSLDLSPAETICYRLSCLYLCGRSIFWLQANIYLSIVLNNDLIFTWQSSPHSSHDLCMIPGIDSPGLVACIHEVSDICVRGDGKLGQILHVRAHQRVLSYPQVPFVLGVEQISYSLTVDLHVTDLKINQRWH